MLKARYLVTVAAAGLILLGAGCAQEAIQDVQMNGGDQKTVAADSATGQTTSPDASAEAAGVDAPDLSSLPPGLNPLEDLEPTGTGDPNDSTCVAKDGTEMTLGQAKQLGQAGECGSLLGEFDGGGMCNYETETWWVTIFPKSGQEKEGCNPACVVNVVTKKVEVNWRCTGLKR